MESRAHVPVAVDERFVPDDSWFKEESVTPSRLSINQ
jgi:hypothetical protein